MSLPPQQKAMEILQACQTPPQSDERISAVIQVEQKFSPRAVFRKAIELQGRGYLGGPDHFGGERALRGNNHNPGPKVKALVMSWLTEKGRKALEIHQASSA